MAAQVAQYKQYVAVNCHCTTWDQTGLKLTQMLYISVVSESDAFCQSKRQKMPLSLLQSVVEKCVLCSMNFF